MKPELITVIGDSPIGLLYSPYPLGLTTKNKNKNKYLTSACDQYLNCEIALRYSCRETLVSQ